MRIVSLNTWGGRLFDWGLRGFLQECDADVWCLQEVCTISAFHRVPKLYLHYRVDDPAVWPKDAQPLNLKLPPEQRFQQWLALPWVRTDLLEQLKAIFPHHDCFFAPVGEKFLYYGPEQYGGMQFGNALFMRRGLAVDDYRHKFVLGEYRFGPGGPDARTAQLVRLRMRDGSYASIGNIHGTWGGSKGAPESDERRRQATEFERLVDSIVWLGDRTVLCGDYNLPRGSVYLKEHCERFHLVDLIDVHDVADTLSSIGESSSAPEWRCVDHMLVSPALKDAPFRVCNAPEDRVVSDHAPLVFEFA